MKVNAIVTMPPYAPFIDEVLRHPIVSGIRLNTVMPIKGLLEETIKKLYDNSNEYSKELWLDLKCRQLRIKSYGVPPFTEIELTQKISVKTPVKAYFSDGAEMATVLEVQDNKLIMQEGPKRVVGPGESVNITDSSLVVEGYLTENDEKYIEASLNLGLHNYMVSFVESQQDISELLNLDPNARVIAKIESRKGLEYVDKSYRQPVRLMAARGDLYIQVEMPHHIIEALEKIINKDANAVVASRIFSSLESSLEPSCQDIGDAANLLEMGYRTFMLGDNICMERESIISGLNLLYAMGRRY